MQHEYMNTRVSEDGEVVSVLISRVGGGTVGNSYEGLWDGCITSDRGMLWEFGGLRTGTPATHEEIVDIAMDFWQA